MPLANKDAKKHILATTFDYEMKSSDIMRVSRNKRDQTKAYQMHRLEQQVDKIDKSKIKLNEKWEAYLKSREEKGLFCCRKVDPMTQDRCMRVFSSYLSRENHENDNKNSKCTFPPTDLVTHMHLLHLEGNLAFCLATGAMINRCDATNVKGVKIRDGDQRIERENWFRKGCYNSVRRMNKRATESLLADLEYLFLAGLQRDNIEKGGANKYTPLQALTYLLNLKMPDGRRKYSFASNNKNGPPPSIKYLKSWFSRRARQEVEKSENSNGIATGNEGNDYANMTLARLKKITRTRLGIGRITKKKLILAILSTYNELDKVPDYHEGLSDASVSDLEEMCKNLKLRFDIDEVGVYVKLLEFRDRVEKMKKTQSSSEDDEDGD